jgi:very-short-patch-repair endonuclease
MKNRRDDEMPLPLREGPRAKGVRGRGPEIVRARELRKESTGPEKKLWETLRRKRVDGLRFRRQYPIGPYFADFVCLPARLIVEVDGGQHADNDEQIRHDKARTAWLESQNFRVLRFWNLDVMDNLEGVIDRIADAVRTPPPAPSRKGRGRRL